MIDVRPGARPDELVPGDPDDVRRLAARLTQFATAATDAAAGLTGLTGLESEHWSGRAADLFRAAVGSVPRELSGAAAAFAAAARALTRYADALRDAQATAAAAVRLVERSTADSTAADRQTAAGMVERARAEVAEAARSAAARLADAAADAPAGSGLDRSGSLPAVSAGGTTVRAVSEYRLAEPDQYLGSMHDLPETVHFSQDHQLDFAGADAERTYHGDWQAWADQDAGLGLGRVDPEVLTGLGTASGLTVIGHRGRDRTAFGLLGLDEAEVRGRRERLGGSRPRDGVAAPVRAGRLRGAGAWRTRLASPPGSGAAAQAWAGPEANPLPRTDSAEAVRLPPADGQVSGVVLHTGPPADERQPGAGAS